MNADVRPLLALHIDDLGASLGANVALVETIAAGSVMSGSIITAGSWLPDLLERTSGLDVDLGVHLALNSESAAFRWRPLTTQSAAAGLVDADGYMWADVGSLRAHADPAAVRDELHAQIDVALAAGVDVSHLDHHMGAALAPEFVEVTVDVAIDRSIPMLFPHDIAGYVAGVDWFDADLGPLIEQGERLRSAGLAFADRFIIPLRHLGEPVRPVLEAMATTARPGYNYVSLHCAAGLDIAAIHPEDAAWRIGEHALLSDPDFVEWLRSQPVTLVDVRSHV